MVHGQAELIGVAIACPRWGSIPVASATWRAKVDTCPKSLEESRNFRHEARQFARTTILGPCVKRLGMSSYLLALNGWGLYAYGRLGNLRL
jgi:hypothetical protein